MRDALIVGGVGLVLVAVIVMLPDGSSDAPDAEADGPREFRAERPEGESGEEALEATVQTLVARVVADPAMLPAREAELLEEIATALDENEIGDEDRRAGAAQLAVSSISAAATQFAGDHSGSDELRRRALRQQSADLTRQLLENSGHVPVSGGGFPPRPEGYRQLSWNELTDIDYAEGDPLPEQVTRLDGEQVAMAGFLVRVGYEGQALLVQSVWSCCFGRAPEIHEAVVVHVPGDVQEEWFNGIIRVVGTLEVGEDYDGDYLLSIYRMRALQVDVFQR